MSRLTMLFEHLKKLLRAALMLRVLTLTPNKTKRRGMKKLMEVVDMFTTLTVVTVSWARAHVQTRRIVSIKYVRFGGYFNYISIKLLNIFNMKL